MGSPRDPYDVDVVTLALDRAEETVAPIAPAFKGLRRGLLGSTIQAVAAAARCRLSRGRCRPRCAPIWRVATMRIAAAGARGCVARFSSAYLAIDAPKRIGGSSAVT
jgi:hypothetical protein